MTEKWDKRALADYVRDIIKDLDGECLDVELCETKHTIYLEVRGE